MNVLRLMLLTGICVPLVSVAQQELSTQKQKVSYAVGVSIAQRVQQNIDVDVDALTLAIRDVLAGEGARMTPEEIQATLEEERRKVTEMQTAIAEKSKQAGEMFLAENMKQEGVVQTDSGLQYKIIEEGAGESPTATDPPW